MNAPYAHTAQAAANVWGNALCVKWDTVSDELVGTAKLIQHLLECGETRAEEVCIAVPNRNWAIQARRACRYVGLPAEAIPIRHYRAVEKPFDRVFLVGCVEGLMIPPLEAESHDDAKQAQEEEACRASFFHAISQARSRAVVSSFVKIDADIAQQAGIRFTRRKTEQGKRIALCSPSRLLDEAGSQRPATIGGQALLRTHGLN